VSHMVACLIVWQIALPKLGVPCSANLEGPHDRTVVTLDLAMCISDSLVTL